MLQPHRCVKNLILEILLIVKILLISGYSCKSRSKKLDIKPIFV